MIILGWCYHTLLTLICSYYRRMYMCSSNTLRQQPNCNRSVVITAKEAIRQFALPFTTNYNCSIAITPNISGSSCNFSGTVGYFGEVKTVIYYTIQAIQLHFVNSCDYQLYLILVQKNCRFNASVTMTLIKRRKRQKFVYCIFAC